jgi:flagellar assembly protein FliH
MARIIKAPNVIEDRAYTVVERHKVLKFVEDEAAEIIANAQDQEQMILQSAAEQAEEIIQNAEADAEVIRQTALDETSQTREEGKQEGYNAGYQEGIETAKKEASELVNTLNALLQEGQSTLENKFMDEEAEIRRMVCDIVGRIVKKEINIDDQTVVRVTLECIRMASDRQNLLIMIHPEDKALIEKWVPDFSRRFDDIDKITVEEDPRVDKGGVIIETRIGVIDGRIETQAKNFEENVMNP